MAMFTNIAPWLASRYPAGAKTSLPKRKPGRPPKRPADTLLTAPRKAKRGRPRKYDTKAILALVDDRRSLAATQARPLQRGSALCELLAEAMQTREPQKYKRLEKLRDAFEEDYSKRVALRRALEQIAALQLGNLERLLSYAVNGRPASKKERRPKRR